MNFDDVMLNALLNRQMGMGVQVMADGTELIAPPIDVVEQMTVGTPTGDEKVLPLSTFGKMAADVPAGLLKGGIQGTAGLAGDVVAFGKGIAAAINPQAGEKRLDAFLRAIGDPVEVFGQDITTEGIAQLLDELIGPLVPKNETDQVRIEAAKVVENVGELFGAGKTITDIGKGTAKGIKAVGKKAKQSVSSGGSAAAAALSKNNKERM
jgi:hypothetical protein